VHLVLAAADSRDSLKRELSLAFSRQMLEPLPGLFTVEPARESKAELPHLVFARQCLPHAREVRAPSIRTWAELLVDAVAGVLPDGEPWALHVFPFEEVAAGSRLGARAWHSRTRKAKPAVAPAEPTQRGAGGTRCRMIREAAVELLQKRRRHLGRALRHGEAPFFENEALLQLVLTSAETGYLSLAPAPLPFRMRRSISCFAGGNVALAVDKQAPSRAFAKLVEAEARMGRRIGARETCVDLGASPGSFTYVAAQRGARVTAVDRSELRDDLMRHPRVRFERADAFRFAPATPVDWLLCDVIARADRSAELLSHWLRERWCDHFVVTLKLDAQGGEATLTSLERELSALASEHWLLKLSANKKEVCAFGTRS
jgi:23S rRNA (cytidine2498-2'-O)-methyltransferase